MEEMTPRDLYERFRGKACKRFPKDAKKKEMKEAHRIKMEMKEYMRKNLKPDEEARPALANISVHHENFGETPHENEIRMREKSS